MNTETFFDFLKNKKKTKLMLNSFNIDQLPVKDLFFSGVIIFVMSTIIANLYNPILGFIYAFGNFVILTFLGWLYQETWSD